MKVLVVTEAERSHFLNLVPLAWALRAAGNEVLVASQPELGPVVRAAGLPFASVSRDHQLRRVVRNHLRLGGRYDFDMTEDREEVLTWDYLLKGYQMSVSWWWRLVNDPLVEPLVDLCRGWRPDLVVWEPLTYAAAIAAEASGSRHVRYLWGVDLFARMREVFLERMADQPEDAREDPLASWIATRAARHGVDYSETLTTGHATVEQLPPELRLPTPDHVRYLPVGYIPYNGRAVVPDWLRTPPDRPRVCVSLGMSTTTWYGGHEIDLAGVLEGMADLDAEVVATVPAAQRGDLGAVPSNVRLADYLPLHALTPTCDAVVAHGGPGTALTALSHGVPQLHAPGTTMFDTVLISELIEKAGAGRLLPPGEATAESVVREVRVLMEDSGHARAARALRDRMAALPSHADLARTLTELTRE